MFPLKFERTELAGASCWCKHRGKRLLITVFKTLSLHSQDSDTTTTRLPWQHGHDDGRIYCRLGLADFSFHLLKWQQVLANSFKSNVKKNQERQKQKNTWEMCQPECPPKTRVVLPKTKKHPEVYKQTYVHYKIQHLWMLI